MATLEKKEQLNWGAILSDNGLITSLHLKWFKGQRKLNPQDLELEEKAEDLRFDKLFQLGRRSIIPPNTKADHF